MGLITKVFGIMIRRMAVEECLIMFMVIFTMESILMENAMEEEELITHLSKRFMTVIGLMTRDKVKASSLIEMETFVVVNLEQTTWREN